MVDLAFYSLYALFAAAVGWVLFRYRREPLYDPRILFSLAASLWLFILHGYLNGFEGYLAAKPGFYTQDLRVLSAMALGLMLLGFCAFVGGASLGTRMTLGNSSSSFHDYQLLTIVCVVLIAIAILNFMANVMLISGGNVVQYVMEVAQRREQVADNQGISAVGYLFGFIGVQVLAFLVGRRPSSRMVLAGLFALVLTMVVVRFSQGRIFQTLVLLGASYVSYAMGAALREGTQVPWYRHVHYLILAGLLGVSFYFLRLLSALDRVGIKVSWQTVSDFSDRIVHFAFERGNVPNFPIVFTIIDKIPSEEGFLLGRTLFNWAVVLIPSSILEQDYLISLWIKNTWYLDIEGGGLPPTAVGEWYANFGIAGVIAGMFIVGYALGLLYKLAKSSESPYLAVLWANVVFGFVVIYPKTDLAQVPVFSIVILGGLWLLVRIMKDGARHHLE